MQDTPWQISTAVADDDDDLPGIRVLDNACRSVAVVFGKVDSPEAQTIARLFAAAPDLLAALKLALEYWEHRQQRYRNRHPVWVTEAREAILKAEGR